MLPCSVVHWRILPAVSRELAACLEKDGCTRAKIASVLGTSEAAVSQYISGKRGSGRLPKAARRACAILAKRIAKNSIEKGGIDVAISKIIVLAKGSKLGKNDPCAICMKKKVLG
jgi:predicted transcriptional regulator